MPGHFVHEKGLCETVRIGHGTRIWAFAHVLPGAVVGSDCNICDGVFIENDVTVGDRVTVKCGVQLWDGITIEDDVFIGPNATFTNDPFPRSRRPPQAFSRTVVRRGASIGANATILPGIEIGAGAMIGAGSVVTRTVPPNAVVMGNPAGIVGYVSTEGADSPSPSGVVIDPTVPHDAPRGIGVGNVTIHSIRRAADLRGDIVVGEFSNELPFVPQRYFLLFNVPTRDVRGEYANRTNESFVIAAHGSCRMLVDDGVDRKEIELNRPDIGVFVPPMTWTTQFRFSPDCVLLVFASKTYDPADYIRSYAEFSDLVADR